MKIVFLDRDGVINKYPGDFEYVKTWKDFTFLPNVKDALKKLKDNGFKIFVISNQAGVSKGIYSREALDLITNNMLQELSKDHINIDGVYYCIHRQEDNCSCRKPKTGLIDNVLEKIKKSNFDSCDMCYFIGDTIQDVQAGKVTGLKTILIFSGKEKPQNKNNWQIQPDFTAQDLSEAVDLILKI